MKKGRVKGERMAQGNDVLVSDPGKGVPVREDQVAKDDQVAKEDRVVKADLGSVDPGDLAARGGRWVRWLAN